MRTKIQITSLLDHAFVILVTGLALAVPAAIVISTAGCGAGSGSSAGGSVASRSTGKLTLNVKWPAPGRLIPAGSNSIVATLQTSSGGTVSSQTLTRPSSPPWTSTATFDNLAPGQFNLAASAFPGSTGTGSAQASGSSPATITSGQQTVVTVTMVSTIDHITVTPPSPTVNVGATIPLTATAYDAAGDVVLVAPGQLVWYSQITADATVDGSGNVTGIAPGTSKVSAQDTETGKTGTDPVTIVQTVTSIGPTQAIETPNGKYLYVSRGLKRDIKLFTIGTGGALTASSAATTTLSGQFPISMWVANSSTGTYMYVVAGDYPALSPTLQTNARLYQFNVQADGTLAPMSVPTVATQTQPVAVIGDSAGKYVFDIDEAGFVRAFAVGTNGALTQNGSDFNLGLSLEFQGPVAISHNNSYLYCATGDGGCEVITINTNGTLVSNSIDLSIPDILGITTSPNQSVVYLSTPEGLEWWAMSVDGSFGSMVGFVKFSDSELASAVLSGGSSAYGIGSSTPNNIVAQFSVAEGGGLKALSPATVAAGSKTSSITITLDGKYVYVTDYSNDAISQYSVGSGGGLTALSPPTVGS